MANAPLYLVAWPVAALDELAAVPANATCLITEWQSLLEPLLMADNASGWLYRQPHFQPPGYLDPEADWTITDRIVEADSVWQELLRSAARSPQMAKAFRDCPGTLRYQDGEARPIRDLAVWDENDEAGTVLNEGLPILLGMLTLVMIRPGITYHGQSVWDALRAAENRATE